MAFKSQKALEHVLPKRKRFGHGEASDISGTSNRTCSNILNRDEFVRVIPPKRNAP